MAIECIIGKNAYLARSCLLFGDGLWGRDAGFRSTVDDGLG